MWISNNTQKEEEDKGRGLVGGVYHTSLVSSPITSSSLDPVREVVDISFDFLSDMDCRLVMWKEERIWSKGREGKQEKILVVWLPCRVVVANTC